MRRGDIQDLKFRYLLWLYKTTKEEFDRIERKFTQIEIDKKIMRYMRQHVDSKNIKRKSESRKFLADFKEYISKKEKDGVAAKFDGKKFKADYYHLSMKLKAIEKVTIAELGRSRWRLIKNLHEQEMRRRIIEAQDHT
jgi:hypothetical protein